MSSAEIVFLERQTSLIAKISSEIDHHNAARLRESIDSKLFYLRPKQLILDFSSVEFMDSSGLGLIMGRYALVQKLGGSLAVLDPSPAVLKIMRLAGMERMISVLKTKEKKDA